MPSFGICLGLGMTVAEGAEVAQVETGISRGAGRTSSLGRAPLEHISHSRDRVPLCFTSRVLLREQEAPLPPLYRYICCLGQMSASNLSAYRLLCAQPKACLN